MDSSVEIVSSLGDYLDGEATYGKDKWVSCRLLSPPEKRLSARSVDSGSV